MEVTVGSRVGRGQELRPAVPGDGYIKEFTRHSNDVLMNLNELRHRNILTDATLVIGNMHLRAHSAVLVACSGFFYSLYSNNVLLHGHGSREQFMTVSLPNTLDASSVSLLLDFMYTSRLPLTPSIVSGVLAAAAYLQMDHVADTCRGFLQLHCPKILSSKPPQRELDSGVSPVSALKERDFPAPSPLPLLPIAKVARVPVVTGGSLKAGAFPTCQGSKELKGEPESPHTGSPTLSPNSPDRSSCQPNSPAESNTCRNNIMGDVKTTPDPKACNWKKYKYIVLNPLCAATTSVKVEQTEDAQRQALPTAEKMDETPKVPTEAWSGEVPGQIDRQGQASCYEGSGQAPPLGPPPSLDNQILPWPLKDDPDVAHHAHHPVRHDNYYVSYCYPSNTHGNKSVCSAEKPYRCNVCGAQFNRPANLKTHSRIHSGEKPYRCDTCGARFVQVAHLRAHVLIHTGEKPYPCNTCGTRFRHLQTLKSHMRIHTGEKPYTCEKCDLHFRHKSQLRLHLRQKHGAVTNTKIRYKVLTEPYPALLQAS